MLVKKNMFGHAVLSFFIEKNLT